MYELNYLVKRNIKLFFKDKRRVFTMFFSPLVTVLIFILFAKYLFTAGTTGAPEEIQNQIGAGSLMVGVLSMTTLTNAISLSVLIVSDNERKVLNDLSITPVRSSSIRMSYLIVNILINIAISTLIFILMLMYVAATKGFQKVEISYGWSGWDLEPLLDAPRTFAILGVVILSAIMNSAFFAFVFSYVKSSSAFSALVGALSSVSGFFIGAFVPIDRLPKGIAQASSLLPGAQITQALKYITFNNATFSSNEFASFHNIYFVGEGNMPIWGSIVYVIAFLALTLLISSVVRFNRKRK
ncbi:ABC transporter permease [Metamycoplasma neophronis]|uniref:ABC transporter permease n=1 Tax=Metamycoplasma neophronis TaxID=872983 RepID=A0ABY2Z026_9BACT|nr:ABC transporter permease [Metamycoplasma neophronis]TPR54101.1 ABC transporter permease [Metamycoplasma neophronis]